MSFHRFEDHGLQAMTVVYDQKGQIFIYGVSPFKKEMSQILTNVMKQHTEPMMDYCEFFATEEEAIAACREVNRGLNSKDPACCVVVDGPEDNCAVVDLDTAKDLLDFGEESPLPCLIVTD